MDPLVAALIERQHAEGLGNNGFARKLGVDKGTWSKVRRGKMAVKGEILAAVLRIYPGIMARVARELDKSNDGEVDLQQVAV